MEIQYLFSPYKEIREEILDRLVSLLKLFNHYIKMEQTSNRFQNENSEYLYNLKKIIKEFNICDALDLITKINFTIDDIVLSPNVINATKKCYKEIIQLFSVIETRV